MFGLPDILCDIFYRCTDIFQSSNRCRFAPDGICLRLDRSARCSILCSGLCTSSRYDNSNSSSEYRLCLTLRMLHFCIGSQTDIACTLYHIHNTHNKIHTPSFQCNNLYRLRNNQNSCLFDICSYHDQNRNSTSRFLHRHQEEIVVAILLVAVEHTQK